MTGRLEWADELVPRMAPRWAWEWIDEILASAPDQYPIRARMALEAMREASEP